MLEKNFGIFINQPYSLDKKPESFKRGLDGRGQNSSTQREPKLSAKLSDLRKPKLTNHSSGVNHRVNGHESTNLPGFRRGLLTSLPDVGRIELNGRENGGISGKIKLTTRKFTIKGGL